MKPLKTLQNKMSYFEAYRPLKTYKGILITQLFPSGYFEAYLGEGKGFVKADTLQGIKDFIDSI